MKYIDEYRDADVVHKLAAAIRDIVTQPHTLMEVCGGQTHSIVKFGIDSLLPDGVSLIHGPGCPVCVTPAEVIDRASWLASRQEVTLCTFGDMLRVPGHSTDLQRARSSGGDVRIVYSPLDAVDLARKIPDREVVFLGVGFETTAPANAMAVQVAHKLGLENFSMLASHVLVPPALEALLQSPDCRVQAFLAAGHVCTVMGCDEYHPIAERYKVPIVVTGFEPVDILQGIFMCIRQREEGRAEVENQYSRSVRAEGNVEARRLIERIFTVSPRNWRGLGPIPESGLRIADEYARFDAERKFDIPDVEAAEHPDCISGLILQGIRKPAECPSFGTECTPLNPLGAPMVSNEGACAAYYRYRLHTEEPIGRAT